MDLEEVTFVEITAFSFQEKALIPYHKTGNLLLQMFFFSYVDLQFVIVEYELKDLVYSFSTFSLLNPISEVSFGTS